MSQGVIRSLKGYSMGLSGWKLIEAIEKNKPLAEFSILHAIQILDIAWCKVTAQTVGNCFAKAEISKEKLAEALLDTDNPFKDLQDWLDKLADRCPKFFPEGATKNNILSVDDSVYQH